MKKIEPIEQIAQDVIMLAEIGGMPDSYWLHDSRIDRACKVLGWTPEQARTWALKERGNW